MLLELTHLSNVNSIKKTAVLLRQCLGLSSMHTGEDNHHNATAYGSDHIAELAAKK